MDGCNMCITRKNPVKHTERLNFGEHVAPHCEPTPQIPLSLSRQHSGHTKSHLFNTVIYHNFHFAPYREISFFTERGAVCLWGDHNFLGWSKGGILIFKNNSCHFP